MKAFLLAVAALATIIYLFLLFRVSAFRTDRPEARGYFGRPLEVASLHQLFRPELYSAPGRRLLPWLRAALWFVAVAAPLGLAALVGILSL